jgi:integrase
MATMTTIKFAFTEERIKSLAPTERELFAYDTKAGGLGVRCYPTGRKVYFIQYRVGAGRKARQRRLPIATTDKISLEDARKVARARFGEIAAGGDPQAARKETLRAEDARLDKAVILYEAALKRRKVVNRATIVATLRRELVGPVGKVDLATIDRQAVAKQVTRLEDAGKPGAAQDLRAKATAFLNWSVDRGLIAANPLAGWRRERATRAQRVERKGRALPDSDIAAMWNACSNVPPPFGDYVRILILLGQRRGETAAMSWQDVDLESGVWTIPASVAKNGRAHRVPLPVAAIDILKMLKPTNPTFRTLHPLIFRGRDQKAMSGWTQRVKGLVDASGVAFTLHDFRRSFRSGLARLGVQEDLAEMMLNHSRADLIEAYDRAPREAARRDAADKWADHVMNVVTVENAGAEVVELALRRA